MKKEPFEITVEYALEHEFKMSVTMLLKMGTDKAILSGGWAQAVREFELVKDMILVFDFIHSKRNGLELMIVPLWRGYMLSTSKTMSGTYNYSCKTAK